MNKIKIIIAREFNERVRKKSFIITTVLMPVLMIVMMAAPSLIMIFAKGEKKDLLVIDQSGIVVPQLESSDELTFIPTDQSLVEARANSGVFGVLWIGENIVEEPSQVHLYTNSSSSMLVEENISSQIESVIEKVRLSSYNIENLEQIMKNIKVSVTLTTYRNDQTKEGGEAEEATSSMVSYMLGLVLGMLLYMILLLYGSMVMTSVIEEKGSRVLDVLVSSVSPFQLLMGKILGVAAVAVTQVVIWAVLVCGVGSALLPTLMPDDIMQTVEAVQAGVITSNEAGLETDMLSALSFVTNTGKIMMMFVYLILFLLGGFLLYSAMFAAVGSAVDSIQDAQQLQTPITIPIILSIMLAMAVFNDPNSAIAFWGSMIPFCSPVVMMARIPFDIPEWQIWTSLVVLFISVVGMVWLGGKIYRVGIFMHGKKPSFKEMMSWIKQ